MKLFEAATAILLVISVVYFVDWALTPEPVKQCYHKVTQEDGRELGVWIDCTAEDLATINGEDK